MKDLIKNENNFITINKSTIEELKKKALKSPRNMARLLMHISSNDHVQEMLIVFGKNALIPPNKSLNKSESLHLIEGKILLIIFDDNGNIKNKIIMKSQSNDNDAFIYRFNKCLWHTMIALSEIAVVHEILEGPFTNQKNVLPNWVPQNSEDLKAFLHKHI